jgi:hypothetical protein
MPLCPQITNTPITVSLTSDFTVTNVVPVLPANTEQLDAVIVLADGKTKAFYQTTAPTVGVSEGDIWFDTDDGNKQYYYNGTAWVSVQDTAIAAAQSAATAAQTTADGKNKVFRQTSTPTATAAGDLWFDTDDDNRIYRWSGTSWVANDLGNNALASISANKITAGTIDASVITVSNINAGNISTGTLAAARIATGSLDANKLTAGTILASNIATGTITATQIAAGTITVDKLSAGTLTGFTIQTNSVNNRIIMGSSNNALSFYYNGNPVAHMVATTGGAGVWLHNGATASPSTRSYPLVGMSTSDASLEGSSTYQIVSSSTGNVIYGAATLTSSINVNASATFGTSNTFEYLSSSGTLRSLYTYGVARTSSTRTMIIDSNGNFGTTASTRRKKHEIQSYKIDSNALLNLDVKTFKYKPEIDEAQTVQYGFIAEEAQELGLDELIQYDSTGIPDYFAYEKLPIFLLQLIKELKAEIDQLKGE